MAFFLKSEVKVHQNGTWREYRNWKVCVTCFFQSFLGRITKLKGWASRIDMVTWWMDFFQWLNWAVRRPLGCLVHFYGVSIALTALGDRDSSSWNRNVYQEGGIRDTGISSWPERHALRPSQPMEERRILGTQVTKIYICKDALKSFFWRTSNFRTWPTLEGGFRKILP